MDRLWEVVGVLTIGVVRFLLLLTLSPSYPYQVSLGFELCA